MKRTDKWKINCYLLSGGIGVIPPIAWLLMMKTSTITALLWAVWFSLPLFVVGAMVLLTTWQSKDTNLNRCAFLVGALLTAIIIGTQAWIIIQTDSLYGAVFLTGPVLTYSVLLMVILVVVTFPVVLGTSFWMDKHTTNRRRQ